MKFHIAIFTGGRNYRYSNHVRIVLDRLRAEYGDSLFVVSGDASGVDAMVREWTERADYVGGRSVHYAKWEEHGRAAGPIRNRKMLEFAQTTARINPGSTVALYAFRGGAGTADCIRTAKELGIEVKPQDADDES